MPPPSDKFRQNSVRNTCSGVFSKNYVPIRPEPEFRTGMHNQGLLRPSKERLNFPLFLGWMSNIVETATLDQMLHSIYLFIEQVAHGMFDKRAFYRNAVHMVQAGPVTSENQAHFRHEPSLHSVLFQEYNPTYPHKAYTLGYAGRPGGPDFYINVKDNNYIHGPEGSRYHRSSNNNIINQEGEENI